MFATARELGVGVMAYGPMAHGLLTGTFTRDTKFVEWDWRSRGSAFGQALFSAENFPRNVEVADQLKVVAERLGTTLPKLAIAWVLANPAVSVALSGTRRPTEIEHNVGALDVRLSDADLRAIDQIMAGAAGQVEAIPT
jgi:aryl-alcohol dehydrogenase-like predicted oxidoreductase